MRNLLIYKALAFLVLFYVLKGCSFYPQTSPKVQLKTWFLRDESAVFAQRRRNFVGMKT